MNIMLLFWLIFLHKIGLITLNCTIDTISIRYIYGYMKATISFFYNKLFCHSFTNSNVNMFVQIK